MWNNFDDHYHSNERRLVQLSYRKNINKIGQFFEEMPPLIRLMKDVWLGGTLYIR